MKYFIDTEFIKGRQDKTFLGLKYGETKPTIDLISIGIVSESNRDYNNYCKYCNKQIPFKIICTCEESQGHEYITYSKGMKDIFIPSKEYYAISKDFNLKAAWKNEWVKDNILCLIWKELANKEYLESNNSKINIGKGSTYNSLKQLINKYGKTNEQIAEEILDFVNTNGSFVHKANGTKEQSNIVFQDIIERYSKPEFYAYYADYAWVVFCQLFGTMMDLPKGFPMYCNDLKQTLDEKASRSTIFGTFEVGLQKLTTDERYPKQTNEHNALTNARWNYELYKFLNKV